MVHSATPQTKIEKNTGEISSALLVFIALYICGSTATVVHTPAKIPIILT